ncbi:MAG: hypothetical protein LUC85_11135 [Bacteroidales bacterium]|nr:hypothetical protein [Bacteroidales bacterium]
MANKHRGGLNNQKGSAYELIYASKEIVRLLAQFNNWENIFVASQIEDAFVDDFLIVPPDGYSIYHLCKNVQSLDWNKEQKGDPLYDFFWQRAYSLSNQERIKLKLVYSNEECKVHFAEIPDKIKDVTEKEHFKAYPSMNAMVIDNPSFRADINSIVAYNEDGYTYDELCALAEIIKCQWEELGQPNARVSLAQIKQRAQDKYPGQINFKGSRNVEIDDNVVEIFSTFRGFKYRTEGNNLRWQYRRMIGVTALSDELATKIIVSNPQNIFDLISILN